MNYILKLVLIFSGLKQVTACIDFEKCVYETVFQNRSYNKFVRPSLNPNETVTVKVQMVVLGLMNIVEIDGTMVTQSFFRTDWMDPGLTWEPSAFGGVSQISVPANQIWLPDIALTNSATNFYEKTYKNDFLVSIEHTGRVRWSYGGTLTTNCDFNLAKYPYDIQTCSIEIESWLYEEKQLNLTFFDAGGFDLFLLGPDIVWKNIGHQTESILKYNNKFRGLIFTLIWERKPLYYHINITLPCAMLMAVALAVYWLPADCGEKNSLAITVLLAFSVFQIVITTATPVNSDVVPELTQFVIVVMLLATLALLTSMFVTYLTGRDPNPPPRWLQLFCYYFLARLLFMYVNKEDIEDLKKKKSKLEKVKNTMNNIDNHSKNKSPSHIVESGMTIPMGYSRSQDLEKISKDLVSVYEMIAKIVEKKQKKSERDHVLYQWKRIGRIIDRVMFWVTVILLGLLVLYVFLTG